jgi:high-affinity iron transporter
MIAALLLAFREGLEAALILGLVLGVLCRVGRNDQEKLVWLGAGLAALASLVAGLGLYTLGIGLEGKIEQIFEGAAMLLAAGVLTWMIFWMNRQGRAMQVELEQDVRRAVTAGGKWAILSLAFLAVFREGIELALFLTAAAFTATAGVILVGGLLGLGLAALCHYGTPQCASLLSGDRHSSDLFCRRPGGAWRTRTQRGRHDPRPCRTCLGHQPVAGREFDRGAGPQNALWLQRESIAN